MASLNRAAANDRDPWRVFVGIELDEATRSVLAQMLADLVTRAGPVPGRPTSVDGWHVTLRFLGLVDEVGRDRLVAGLDQTVACSPFPMDLTGLGAFPRSSSATVTWIGVVSPTVDLVDVSALHLLADQVEEATAVAGFEPEERPFRPHLTLSRVRPPEDVRRWLSEPFGPVRMLVNSLALFRSRLGPGGAQYEIWDRIPLR